MLGVAHVFVSIPARLDAFKGGQGIVGAVRQMVEQLRRPMGNFLRGTAGQLGGLTRFLLDDDVAAKLFMVVWVRLSGRLLFGKRREG